MLSVIMILYCRHLQQKYRKCKEDPEDVDEMQLDAEHTANVLNSDVKHHTSGTTCNAIGLNTIFPKSQALATSCQSLPRSAGFDMTDNQAYGTVTTPSRIVYEDVQPHLPTAVVPDNSDAHSMTNNNACGIPQFREKSLPRSAGPYNDMTDNPAYGTVTTPSRIVYEDVQPDLPTAVVPDNSDAHSMTNNNAYVIPQFREKSLPRSAGLYNDMTDSTATSL